MNNKKRNVTLFFEEISAFYPDSSINGLKQFSIYSLGLIFLTISNIIFYFLIILIFFIYQENTSLFSLFISSKLKSLTTQLKVGKYDPKS